MLCFKFFLCLLLLASAAGVHSLDPTLNDDVLGLIVFKAGLSDPHSKLVSWNEDDPTPCNWVGIQCSPVTSRVTHLLLDGFSLSGHIGHGLLRLPFLRILSLSRNNFTGEINPDLPRLLPGLRVVDLTDNHLSGEIPDGFFQQCGSLRFVSFARNDLTGRIPASLTACSTLSTLDFSFNRLSGELPTGLWSLTGIKSLDLSDNSLEGEIPEGISSLPDLRTVSFRKNSFSGQLPPDIGSCPAVKEVDFSENSLSGPLPETLRKLKSCVSLSLAGNSFTGQVPHWIGELTSLESLDLSANNISGIVPTSIGRLSQLKHLNLSMNQLLGDLAESISSCRNLFSLDVSRNQLASSNLSSWLFNLAALHNLEALNLSSNALSGEIPPSIGALASLLVLDLSSNMLNGTIPSEIGAAVSLVKLNLNNNLLTGNIPSDINNCSSLTSLILSKNKLTGPIPAAIGDLTSLEFIDLSFNNFTGTLPKELTNLSHLLSFNISHNNLQGELPVGVFFNSIPPSSVAHNPSLCGSVVKRSCPSNHLKPIVLNPDSASSDSSPESSSSHHYHRKVVLSISALIAIGAAAFITLSVIAITLLNIHVRSSISRTAAAAAVAFSGGGEDFSCYSSGSDSNYGKLVMFSGKADSLAGCHDLLNKDFEIGRGGFGVAYKTMLQDGRSVVIKKLAVSSLVKSQHEFEREVKKLGKVKHRNLVAMEGYYWTPSLQLLIHECVSGGSLYKNLHDEASRCLPWRQRFNVILGMARGIALLHSMDVVHYNLKSSNVLIDEGGEAKVGDFGLARLLPTLDRCILSGKVQSALGYVAPEFACRTVKITEKCDVYGFGILVLEVVTGKRPVEYMEDDVVVLSDVVRRELEDGRLEECVDVRLRAEFPADEAIPVVKLGLICASQVPSNRPDMEEVVKILELIQSPADGQELME
ncbi:unnamed protein product [Linum tenue]|uniref:Protein kinase domain-containing protein n=1 Tax=Linum tenue TaxID=586396 RepID=A0AAV0KR01_9ROSI|nr:unnamed protein product [Linum tenue]